MGRVYQDWTIIEKGVSARETVVTDGQLRLAPGARVEIKNASSAEEASTVKANENSTLQNPNLK